MEKHSKVIFTISAFVIAGALIGYAYYSKSGAEKQKKMEFERESALVLGYASTTANRVANSVVTLPEQTISTGLKDGHGVFVQSADETQKGTVKLLLDQLVTKFVKGSLEANKPRLDALVPMFVTGDSTGTSMFIVLFKDRGDAALEISYARLGRSSVVIEKINILEPDANTKQEYKVDVVYKKEGTDPKTGQFVSNPKETIIPVVDGHFDPAGTVNK